MTGINQHLGIIGGGQLGKMMILEAKKFGMTISIYDPDPTCPAHSIADSHMVQSFNNHEALKAFARDCDVITYEFEHIAVEPLKQLENEGIHIYPSPKLLEMIQNKFVQKEFLKSRGLPLPQFYEISLEDASHNFPLMLKTCTGGYDGKGNFLINNQEELIETCKKLDENGLTYYGEDLVDFTCEISVIVARNHQGDNSVYPIGENHHENSILQCTKIPANIDEQVEEKAKNIAIEVMEAMEGRGLFCIECFVTREGDVLINEIAPRPHNSGHYSIEACYTSQFEQCVRSIMGLPLGDPSLLRPAVMMNIIGEEDGVARYLGVDECLAVPGVSLHIYGKKEIRQGRKMGHLTALADNQSDAYDRVMKAYSCLKAKGGEQ